MSIARHHAEWLALTEISGPFLSLEVLLQIFPQGLDAHDPENFRLLKQAYQEWSIEKADRAIHRAWIEWVLHNTFGFPKEIVQTGQAIASHLRVEIPQHQETLVPDWVVVDPDTNKAQLLIQQVLPSQKLEGTYKNSHWAASPATRLIELLRGTDIRLGLLTNGEQWMLIHVPKLGTASLVSWYGNLWVEEKITLRSFRALLGVQRFFGVSETETLAQLFERSKNHQQEITDQLGLQVRRSVEVLVQRLDRIDQDYQGQLLAGISDQMLYEAALFVMMRLVFLLSAEEKGLLLLGQERYDKNYALSTLQQSLREMADHSGEEILERRYDAWYRLLALFRAVHGGVYHHSFQLPAYGGDLFDPDKFPFLEGRFGEQTKAITIDNRTVLHLLESLQILQVKVPGGGVEPRRLSFKGLEVEQIGHVYESLLDHRVVRADSTVLGLEGTKSKEPEIALDVLETEAAKGEEALLSFLKKQTGRRETALKKLIALQDFLENKSDLSKSPSIEGFRGPNLTPYEENRYLIGCRNDRALWSRIKPFYRLIRKDTYGNPLIIPEGSVYVTTGTARRESGTHYTPKHLTEEIVKYTLEPLVYEGVSEGKPQEEWRLISVQALLNLKICDPTMGSGAFLVQVCRYLADRLVEAWADLEERHPKQVFTVFGNISKPGLDEALLPDTPEERLIVAKRLIAERCLYGVDKNPLAVEMAKLSLWLETLQKDRPFTFVDHALRCGDSLVGVSVDQLRFWSLDTSDSSYQLGIGADEVQRLLKEAIDKRLEIEQFSVVSTQDQKRKESLLAEADARLKDLKDRANLLVSSYLANVKKSEQEDLRAYLLMVANGKADIRDYQRQDLSDLDQLRPFHWELEFPEVFQPVSKKEGENVGFDAIVGNPPYIGGQKITGVFNIYYRNFLVQWIANNKRGSADSSAYFVLKNIELMKKNSYFGLVATNTISQGDTRAVGLDQIINKGIIYRAISSRDWEGTANLEVSYIWLKKGEWKAQFYLDNQLVKASSEQVCVYRNREYGDH